MVPIVLRGRGKNLEKEDFLALMKHQIVLKRNVGAYEDVKIVNEKATERVLFLVEKKWISNAAMRDHLKKLRFPFENFDPSNSEHAVFLEEAKNASISVDLENRRGSDIFPDYSSKHWIEPCNPEYARTVKALQEGFPNLNLSFGKFCTEQLVTAQGMLLAAHANFHMTVGTAAKEKLEKKSAHRIMNTATAALLSMRLSPEEECFFNAQRAIAMGLMEVAVYKAQEISEKYDNALKTAEEGKVLNVDAFSFPPELLGESLEFVQVEVDKWKKEFDTILQKNGTASACEEDTLKRFADNVLFSSDEAFKRSVSSAYYMKLVEQSKALNACAKCGENVEDGVALADCKHKIHDGCVVAENDFSCLVCEKLQGLQTQEPCNQGEKMVIVDGEKLKKLEAGLIV